jgi:hypothetical protein
MPESPNGPPAGWYQDPAEVRAIRWWDGSRWTVHQALTVPKMPSTGSGTRQPHPKRIQALMALAALTLVSIPINLITTDWAQRAGQNSTQCNGPVTWDQAALGIYLPLLFIALALGCLIAAIVTRVRTRHAQQPVGSGIIAVSLLGLACSLGTGFLASLSVGSIHWCF